MGVLADDGRGSGTDQGGSIEALLQGGGVAELLSPVDEHDDGQRGVGLTVAADGGDEVVDGCVADRRLIGARGDEPILYGHGDGIEHGDVHATARYDGRHEQTVAVGGVAEGSDAVAPEAVMGVAKAKQSLVHGVVVGHGGVGDASGAHGSGSDGVGTEDVFLIHPPAPHGERALEIDHPCVGLVERGGYVAEDIVVAVLLHYCAHTAVEEHITSEKDCQRVSRVGRHADEEED